MSLLVSCFITSLVYKNKTTKNGIDVAHIIRLYHVFRENDGKQNCAQFIEEEFYKMFDIKSMNDEHDCNVVGINSLNIHDANDMQSHKLGNAMFDEEDMFSTPMF